MRISVLLADAHGIGGGNRVIAIHAAHLRDRGHQVRIFARPPPPVPLRQRLRRMIRDGRFRGPPRTPTQFSAANLPVEMIDRHRPIVADDLPDADIVIATWWETAEWMAALPLAKGRHVYFVQDHEVFPYLPVERARATYRLPARKLVVAPWLRDLMASEYGDQRAVLVQNGVDDTQFSAAKRGPSGVPRIGFLHSASPRKNVSLAVAALEAAKARLPKLQAVAFGANRPGRHDRLPGWIEFHHRPSQDRIPEIYASCDAWLFTSISEGFGLPILEAMACRTPVLATPAGAAPELVSQGGGRLLSPDAHAFAAAILDIATMSHDEWLALSDAARATACRHGWAASCARFEEALVEVGNEGGAA